MAEWDNYEALYPDPKNTIIGTVKVSQGIYNPAVDNFRDILVYLPPDYKDLTEIRYPVIYMHDGQNLFNDTISSSGEWHVDEVMQQLNEERLAAIIVGIPNTEKQTAGSRLDEYSPFHDETHGHGGRGDDYLTFILDIVKPLIDEDFRTLPDREHTGIMGSSMGALISLYAFFKQSDVFGFVGVLSPAFWFAKGAIYGFVELQPMVPGKIYLDVGTDEMKDVPPEQQRPGVTSEVYLNDARRMRDLLVAKGYALDGDLLYVEEEGAPHHETAWARRLPAALRFFAPTPAFGPAPDTATAPPA